LKRHLSIAWQKEVAYKLNFVLSVAFEGLEIMLSIVFLNVYLSYYDSFLGYSKSEMIFIIGMAELNVGLIWNILHNVSLLPRLVTDGGLDTYLVKPIHSIFLLAVSEFDLEDIAAFIFGTIFIIIGIQGIHFVITPAAIIAITFSEFMLFFSLFGILWAAMNLSFWLAQVEDIYWIMNSLNDLNKYPFKSFQGNLYFLFVFFYPVILYGAAQLDILTGRMNFGTLFWIFVSSILWFLIGYITWKFGLKRYTSASGSGTSGG
jgi:ABC-2 type transport system permease protein